MFKLNRKTREYTVLLVILLLLVTAADIRGDFRTASSMAMAAIVTFWITGNPLYGLYMAVVVLFLFYILSDTSLVQKIEQFDNAQKLPEALEDVETRLKPKDEELGGEPASDTDAAFMNALNRSSAEDESPPRVGDSVMKKYSDKMETRDLARAQKETFELINSVKQLQDVVESLAPTLREGKKVMDMFEQLKLS